MLKVGDIVRFNSAKVPLWYFDMLAKINNKYGFKFKVTNVLSPVCIRIDTECAQYGSIDTDHWIHWEPTVFDLDE